MGTTTASEAVLSLAREKSISIRELSAGDQVELEKGGKGQPAVSMSTLFPDAIFKFSKASPPLLVLDLSFGEKDIVLAGDVSTAIQNFLAKGFATSTIQLHSDVLEYANSGTASNVSEKFIKSLASNYIVVKSTGKASKPPKKPQFSVRSYTSMIEDIASSSIGFLSDGKKIWLAK